jgi:ferredoxin-NADP reductase
MVQQDAELQPAGCRQREGCPADAGELRVETHVPGTGSPQDHALRDTVLHVARHIDNFTAYTWYETVDLADERSRQGLMDLSQIPLPEDVQVFTCGPLPFMRHVRSTLLDKGVPPSRIRYLRFSARICGPPRWQTADSAGWRAADPAAPRWRCRVRV